MLPSFLPSKTISIIGAGFGLGQTQAGTEKAPEALMQAGLSKLLQELGWKLKDVVAFDFHNNRSLPGGKNPLLTEPFPIHYAAEAGGMCQQLASHTRMAAKAPSFCLTIGGDHSIAIGSIDGLLQAWPDLCVLWIDAHGDFNIPETSPSGNLHGMPLAALTQQFQLSKYPSFSHFQSFLPPERVAIIGARSIDEQEIQHIQQSGAHLYTMSEIDRYGIGHVMAHALRAIDPQGNRPIHLSFDIDALDPSIAPSTGTSVRGGLTYREAHFIAEEAARTNRLVAMDMVEVNPDLASTGEGSKSTIEIAVELIESALGKRTAPSRNL